MTEATTVDKTAITAKAKREYRKVVTAAEFAAWVAKHKTDLGYRAIGKIIGVTGTGDKRTISVRYATQCQKEFRKATTKDEVEAWYAAHLNTLGHRKLGRIVAYPGTDPAALVDS